MVRLANQGANAAGGPAAFSWSAASIGTTNPFAAALEQARQRLDAGGWMENATEPMCYAKSNPTLHDREKTLLPSSSSVPHALAMSGDAELDRWETDGGT